MIYEAFTLYGGPFQNLLLVQQIFYLRLDNGRSSFQNGTLDKSSSPSWLFVVSQPLLNIRLPTYLSGNKLPGKNLKSLGYCGFARHYYRNRCLLSLPRGTKMFQFPRFPLLILCIQIRVTGHDSSRISPFGNLRFIAWLAAPRSLSQLPASFIGILCQGIPCVRLSNFLRFAMSQNFRRSPFSSLSAID